MAANNHRDMLPEWRAARTAKTSFHEKYPARQNWNVPMDATKMLSTSAVGRMTMGAIPNNVIVAI